MIFDVIIGNPPYQLDDKGHGKSAMALYDKFVLNAIQRSPRFIVMIIPARWYTGGKGLNIFRKTMLNDRRIKTLRDFQDSTECFPNVNIAGGICYFLWSRDYNGPCTITTSLNGNNVETSTRFLNQLDIFIRSATALEIINSMFSNYEKPMSTQVMSRKPFGIESNAKPTNVGDVVLVTNKGKGFIERSSVKINMDIIDKYKVITAKASSDNAGRPNKQGKRKVLSKVEILPPGHVCTESYLILCVYDKEWQAADLVKYMQSKVVRFLIAQVALTHNLSKESFRFVPISNTVNHRNDYTMYKHFLSDNSYIGLIDNNITEWPE